MVMSHSFCDKSPTRKGNTPIKSGSSIFIIQREREREERERERERGRRRGA